MDRDVAGATELAEKIVRKAENVLSTLDLEMTLMKWPGEFQAIMWEAVADIATRRAADAKRS